MMADKQTPRSNLIQPFFMAAGFVFFVLGVFILIWPETISFIIEGDVARLFGAALALVGMTDIIMAKTIFAKKDHYDRPDQP